MSELKNSDKIDNYLKIALKFWTLFKECNKKSIPILETLDNAICDNWREPIRLLIERDKKTIEDIGEVYLYLKESEFWQERIYSTSKLRKTNSQGATYFNALLHEKRNLDLANRIPEKEDFEPVLRRHFKNTTPYFISLFSEYLLMIFQKKSKILNGKALEIEIGKLAKDSGNNIVTAVNILKKSITTGKEISQTHL